MAIADSELIVFDSKLKEEKEYWIKRLGRKIPKTAFPADLHSDSGADFSPDSLGVSISPPLLDALLSLTAGSRFLLYTLLLSALKVCLSRYSRSQIVCVGSPALAELNRPNTLVMVSDLNPEKSFKELLSEERESLIEAYTMQRYPIRRLIREAGEWEGGEANRWYEVTLGMEGLHGEIRESGEQIRMRARLEEGRIEIEAKYNRERYSRGSIEKLLEQMKEVVEEGVKEAGRRVGELRMMSEEEEKRVIESLRGERREREGEEVLTRVIEKVVEERGKEIAVESEEEEISYEEMNRRANQVGRYLRRKGMRREELVGVMKERGEEMVTSVMGVMKGGGVYVPIEEGSPKERIRRIVEEGKIRKMIVSREREEEMRGIVEEVIGEREREEIRREGEEEIDIEIEGENLAYVIYTSGSTGSPKGVMNTHRGITNRLLWMQERYQLNCEDRVLQKTPLSFDVSVWELFWPLIVGARLVMAKPGGHKDTDYLVKTIAGRGITTIHFVPSMLQAFLEEENLDTCKSLKRVICSGEVLSPRLQNRFFACMAAELHNLYGPTEAAIDVTFWQCDREDKRRTVPIGKPITNTEILLLGPDLNLVPTGVAGQLHIGGQGVARGYLNRPDLTAEKFIPDAFGKEPGARIYDTGDLARLLDDGNIEYLGRSDHQIKLRGYRIEVSEIEQVLMEYPGVKEAVVVLREFGEDDKRLIAYFVTDDRQAPTADELQGFLASRLPEYMMPWTIVRLESLPLTTSGKLDRSALPAPADPDSRKNGAPVAPRSPVEEIIASIWSEVLEVEKVGVTDDYFALGGHSLKAARIMSRLRKAFQVELPLSVLFERPTVAGLAEEITLASHSTRASEIPPIEHISRDGGIPLSFAQQRIWMLDQLNPGNPVYNILLAVELTGILKAEALERSINEIIRRHEVLRTRFETVEGHPVQVIMPQLALELVVEELRAPDASGIEKEIERLTIEEAHKGFDLSTGPLIRARLLSLSGQEHVFLIAMHHIISDGWSQEIFFREMAALYSAFCAGEPSPLPEPPFQYADYAHWQRVWLTDDVMTEQIDYWRQRLKGIPPPITLSPSRPRPELPGYKGASQSLSLDAEASAPLKALAGREGATMFMVVLAAFKSSLYCHTGQEDIVVGTNFANRNRVEIEGLIGLFLNQAVLRTDLSGNPTFRQILRRVREAVLGAILHEELPFEQVIDELRIKRDLSQGLLFQIKVDYQQISFSPPDIADLILTPMNIDTGMAKFDLSVLMVDAYDGFSISFVYNRELFEEETILEMLDGFERVLKIVGANSDQTLNQLARLVEQEQRKQRIQKRRERKAATLRSLKTIKRRRLITPEPAQ